MLQVSTRFEYKVLLQGNSVKMMMELIWWYSTLTRKTEQLLIQVQANKFNLILSPQKAAKTFFFLLRHKFQS